MISVPGDRGATLWGPLNHEARDTDSEARVVLGPHSPESKQDPCVPTATSGPSPPVMLSKAAEDTVGVGAPRSLRSVEIARCLKGARGLAGRWAGLAEARPLLWPAQSAWSRTDHGASAGPGGRLHSRECCFRAACVTAYVTWPTHRKCALPANVAAHRCLPAAAPSIETAPETWCVFGQLWGALELPKGEPEGLGGSVRAQAASGLIY